MLVLFKNRHVETNPLRNNGLPTEYQIYIFIFGYLFIILFENNYHTHRAKYVYKMEEALSSFSRQIHDKFHEESLVQPSPFPVNDETLCLRTYFRRSRW